MKKTKTSTFAIRRKHMLIVAFLLLLAVVAGGFVKVYYFNGYNDAADLASVSPIRELILNAARDTKITAAVDPKTGDQYFPEARLYLPATNPPTQRLTYDALPDRNATEISVSSETIFNEAAVALYQAKNTEELFKAVPKLQACQRGVNLRYSPFNEGEIGNYTLYHTMQLNNGKTLYMYLEDCAGLRAVADELKNIRSY